MKKEEEEGEGAEEREEGEEGEGAEEREGGELRVSIIIPS